MKSNYEVLGQHIRLVDYRNSDEITRTVLGININKEFIPSVANVIGTDLSRYKLLRKGLFACNPMHVGRDERLPIALYEEDVPAIVSPAYFMFEIADPTILNEEYLMMWFRRPEFDRECWFMTDGSVRGGITWDDLCRIQLLIPPYEQQLEIVEAYRAITERIKLKRKINDNLEAQVNSLYQSMIQANEPNAHFGEIATIQSGKRPASRVDGEYPLIGAGGVMGYINDYNFDEKILVTGRVGTHGIIQRLYSKCWASDNTLVIKSDYYEFAYYFLKSTDWDLLNRGSTQPLVTQTDIRNLPIFIPDIDKLKEFERIAGKLMGHQVIATSEIRILAQTRNMLVSSLPMG